MIQTFFFFFTNRISDRTPFSAAYQTFDSYLRPENTFLGGGGDDFSDTTHTN